MRSCVGTMQADKRKRQSDELIGLLLLLFTVQEVWVFFYGTVRSTNNQWTTNSVTSLSCHWCHLLSASGTVEAVPCSILIYRSQSQAGMGPGQPGLKGCQLLDVGHQTLDIYEQKNNWRD